MECAIMRTNITGPDLAWFVLYICLSTSPEAWTAIMSWRRIAAIPLAVLVTFATVTLAFGPLTPL